MWRERYFDREGSDSNRDQGASRIGGCIVWAAITRRRISSLLACTPLVRYQAGSLHATLQEKCIARFSSRLAQLGSVLELDRGLRRKLG